MEVDRFVFYCKTELASFFSLKKKKKRIIILQHIYNSSVDGSTQEMLVPLLFIVGCNNEQTCTKEKQREHCVVVWSGHTALLCTENDPITSRSRPDLWFRISDGDKVLSYQACEHEEHSSKERTWACRREEGTACRCGEVRGRWIEDWKEFTPPSPLRVWWHSRCSCSRHCQPHLEGRRPTGFSSKSKRELLFCYR